MMNGIKACVKPYNRYKTDAVARKVACVFQKRKKIHLNLSMCTFHSLILFMLDKFILTLLLSSLQCDVVISLNTYISNSTHWQSTSDFIPSPNKPYGNITLHRALRMEFDFIYYGKRTSKQWEQVFRIGRGGALKCDAAGLRLPAMFIQHDITNPENGDRLLLAISQGASDCWDATQPLQTIQPFATYHVIVEFNRTWRYAEWSHDSTTEILQDRPLLVQLPEELYYTPMIIWIADESADIPNITLSNVIIQTWDPITPEPSMNPSSTPTLSPTYYPTISTDGPSYTPTYDPTYTPSIPPTFEPTILPTVTPTIHPAQVDVDQK